MSNNKTIVIVDGYLGNDPESKSTPDGTGVVSFPLGSQHSVKNHDGWKMETTWYRVSLFGDLANKSIDLKKGDRVIVTGSLVPREWFDEKNNRHRTSLEIRGFNVELVRSKTEEKEKSNAVNTNKSTGNKTSYPSNSKPYQPESR